MSLYYASLNRGIGSGKAEVRCLFWKDRIAVAHF